MTTPAGSVSDEVAARERADRQRDQEPTSTSAALICEPSGDVIRAKIGMSTSAAIRAAPTKKLTSERAPGGPLREGAVRHQRSRRPPVVQHEQDRGHGGDARGTRARPG